MAVEVISVENIYRSSSGNITLTIPGDCEAVYVFLGGNYASTSSYFTGTLAGASPDASVMSPGQSGYTQGGCLAFISPPTGSQTLSITFSSSPNLGFTGQAMYVKGGDYTDGWRDAGTNNHTGTTVCSFSLDSEADDLVIGLHSRITSYPGAPTGWTKLGSNSGYNSAYSIGQQCDSPGDPSTTALSAYCNYSNLTAISIPAAAAPSETEVDISVEAGVEVSIDAFVFIDYSDNFTGTTGDPPDSDKWEVVENTNDAWSIYSGALTVKYSTSPYTPENTYFDLRGKYKFAGDFDIQISHSRYNMSSSGTPIWLTLEVINEETGYWAGIGFYSGNGSYGFFACDDTGSGTPHNKVYSRSDLDNLFRVTRSGSTVKCFFYDVSRAAWEGNYGDTDGWTMRSITGDVRVRLAGFSPIGKQCWVAFDNFTINSGDAVAYTPPQQGESEVEAGVSITSESEFGDPVSEVEAGVSVSSQVIGERIVLSEVEAGVSVSSEAGTEVAVLSEVEAGVSVSVDAFIYISYDDVFTGTNGDPPDSSKWEIVENTGDVACIRSNAYGFNFSLSPYAPENSTLDLRGKYLLTGDFDIQVDMIRWSTSNSLGQYHYSVLQVITEDDSEWAYAGYYQNGLYGCFCGDDEGSLTPHNRKANYSTTSNLKFRLTRVSGVITAYRWNGSAWYGFGSSSGYTLKTITDSVRVQLLQYVPSGAKFGMSFDNFAINSGETEPITETGESEVEAGVSISSDAQSVYIVSSEVEAGVSVDSDYISETNAFSEIGAGVSISSDADVAGQGLSEVEAGVTVQAEVEAAYNVSTSEEAGVTVTSEAEKEAVEGLSEVEAGVTVQAEVEAIYNVSTSEEAGVTVQAEVEAVYNVSTSEEAGVSAASDASLEVEINYSDDFTGSNGDPPDSTKWEVIFNASNNTSIQSNKLYCNIYPGAGVSYTFDMRGRYLLSGAFDIQVDLLRVGGAYEGSEYTWAVLEVIDEDEVNYKNVGWHYGNGGADYKYRVGDNTGGNPQGYLAGYWQSNISKVRLVRDGSGNVTAYCWDATNTQWEFNNLTEGYTFSTPLSGPVRVRIAFYGIGTGQLNYSFDNYLINSGETEVAPQLAVSEVEAGVSVDSDTEATYNVSSEAEAGVSVYSEAQTIYGDEEETAGVNVVSEAYHENASISEEVGAHSWSDSFLLAENQFEFPRVSATSDADYGTVFIDPEAGVAVEVDASLNSFVETDSSEIGVEALADAYNYAAWIKENKSKAKKVFIFTLTGSPDVDIPIASFQAQKKNGDPTYLSVVIPSFDYITQVTDRANGEMIIYAGYRVNGEVQVKEEILRADLDDITYYNGPRSKSIVLSGYKTNSFFSKTTTLEKPVTVTLRAGKLQIDFGEVDLFLNPGDVLTVDTDTFTVGSISYQVNTDRESMTVMETA